jgi:hypothetical protein
MEQLTHLDKYFKFREGLFDVISKEVAARSWHIGLYPTDRAYTNGLDTDIDAMDNQLQVTWIGFFEDGNAESGLACKIQRYESGSFKKREATGEKCEMDIDTELLAHIADQISDREKWTDVSPAEKAARQWLLENLNTEHGIIVYPAKAEYDETEEFYYIYVMAQGKTSLIDITAYVCEATLMEPKQYNGRTCLRFPIYQGATEQQAITEGITHVKKALSAALEIPMYSMSEQFPLLIPAAPTA